MISQSYILGWSSSQLQRWRWSVQTDGGSFLHIYRRRRHALDDHQGSRHHPGYVWDSCGRWKKVINWISRLKTNLVISWCRKEENSVSTLLLRTLKTKKKILFHPWLQLKKQKFQLRLFSLNKRKNFQIHANVKSLVDSINCLLRFPECLTPKNHYYL